MNRRAEPPRRSRWRWASAAFALTLQAGAALAADPALALRERLDGLSGELAHSPFGRPLHIASREGGDRVSGDVDALLDQPFARVASALERPTQWCEVMILVINVKHCAAEDGATQGRVTVNIARRPEQPLQDTQQVSFTQRLQAASAGYLRVELAAPEGPLGTHDYGIVLEAMSTDNGRSYLHLHYGYTDSFLSRLAMQTYLGTTGRDKIGFSVVGRTPDGAPAYVQGLRGAIERTTMRYYLAIAAYLDSLSAPPAQRGEHRLREWFRSTERYPRQLHEMSEDDYLSLKRQAVNDGT